MAAWRRSSLLAMFAPFMIFVFFFRMMVPHIPSVGAFATPTVLCIRGRQGIINTKASANNQEDEDDDANVSQNMGPEKSRMRDYISRYLGKNRPPSDKDDQRQQDSEDSFSSEDLSTSTHLVAIPMDTNHELLIELESVQRAVLYHCPILVDACIPPSMIRLPLLYVKAPTSHSARVTTFLAETVQSLVKKHIFQPGTEEDLEDELNADGYKPFTMTFQSLEIDGENNNILSTVGLAAESGTKNLSSMVHDLKTTIEAQGWRVAFPPDPNLDQPANFRPRIPFMELPKDFNDNLNRFKDEKTEISEEDFEFLTSDQGGNGISPIFWCQWWDDVFARNVRLREIGIYPRNQLHQPVLLDGDDATSSSGAAAAVDVSYNMFYLPYETVAFPDASPILMMNEQKFQKYQDQRLVEQQQQMQEGSIDTSVVKPNNADPDILMSKTRNRLEEVYINSADDDFPAEIVEVEGVQNEVDQPESKTEIQAEMEEDEEPDLDLQPITASKDDYIDDWMKSRIRDVVDNRESVKSRIPQKKDNPPIEDNPVFKAYKNGTLVPKTETPKSDTPALPPYPSREHFVGIWRVVTSPTGFPAEETSDEKSENLILRIDGTTAGGPVLDPEFNQKAAGGTWKMVVEEDTGEVKLRIRLVIPPKKDRVIEMLGYIDRMNAGSDLPMASKAFGIPHLEAMAKEANKSELNLMHCGGDVHIEDAITKKNRENIGTFSLMKIQGPLQKGQYTITIPKPIRSQD